MQAIHTSQLQIALPTDWTVFREGAKLIAHGPDNTEIIASCVSVDGGKPSADHLAVLEQVKLRTVDLMRRNASHDELTVTGELSEKVAVSGIGIVSLECTSRDGETHFDQFVLVAHDEVVFLTYEGPVAAAKHRDDIHAAVDGVKIR